MTNDKFQYDEREEEENSKVDAAAIFAVVMIIVGVAVFFVSR